MQWYLSLSKTAGRRESALVSGGLTRRGIWPASRPVGTEAAKLGDIARDPHPMPRELRGGKRYVLSCTCSNRDSSRESHRGIICP